MARDILYLLPPDFPDVKYPGQRFYCADCMFMEGLLARFPVIAERVEVRRHDFPRPRAEVVALVGEANQGLPLLIFGDDAEDGLETGRHGGVRFAGTRAAIMKALAVRYGIPLPHP